MKTSIEDSKKWILKVSAEGKEYRYYYKQRPRKLPIKKNRVCSVCSSHITKIQPPKGHNHYPTELWLKDGNGGWKCWPCYNREKSKSHRGKQLSYTLKNKKRKLFTFKQVIRKGICSNCKKFTRTALHHTEYDPANPLANTIEICIACHNAIHRLKNGQMGSLDAVKRL